MIATIDLNNLKHCPYDTENMERLKEAILKSSSIDFSKANRSAKFCFKKSEKSYQKNAWLEKAFNYANEIAYILEFIVSDWFIVLTDGNSPRKTIYKKMYGRVYEKIKSYVDNEVRLYAKRKGFDIRWLDEDD